MGEADRREEDNYRKRSLPYTPRAVAIPEETRGPQGTQILTCVAAQLKYAASNWWQTEQDLTEFQNELTKYAYYRVKY